MPSAGEILLQLMLNFGQSLVGFLNKYNYNSAIIPNVVPFLFLLLVKQFPGTDYDDLTRFSPPALQKWDYFCIFPIFDVFRLADEKVIICTLTSHFLKVKDVLQTAFFLLCPLISYPVAIVSFLEKYLTALIP